jgi:hypothetical protein
MNLEGVVRSFIVSKHTQSNKDIHLFIFIVFQLSDATPIIITLCEEYFVMGVSSFISIVF